MNSKIKSKKLKTYDEMYKRIGSNIQYLRKARGWTQTALAAECKISQAVISYTETARRPPSQKTINKICDVLDISLEDLLIQDYQAPLESSANPEINEDDPIFKCSKRTYYCYYLSETLPSEQTIKIRHNYKSEIKNFTITILKASSNSAAPVNISFKNKVTIHKGDLEMDGKYAYITCHEFGRDFFLQLIFYYARNKTSKKYKGGLGIMNSLDINRRPVSQYCLITTNAIREKNWPSLIKLLTIRNINSIELQDEPFSSTAVLRLTKNQDKKAFEWLLNNKYI